MNSPADDLDPSRLESASFDLVRRGFDTTAVRKELQRAAQEIRRLRLERDELRGRLAEFDGVSAEHLEAHRVAEALGVEATQVLEAAHLAARERAERAEREAEAVREEAMASAEQTRTEAQAARDETLAEATREAEALVEEGRVRGRDMVAEAQAVRERMLRDLARKRQTGRAQVEQLRAGRDRLLESLSIAQQGLDTSVDDLVNAVPEARSAAERAGLRVTSEPTPTPEELEGEIESARLVGHPLVDDIVDPGAIDDAFVTGEMEALDVLQEVPPEVVAGGAVTESTTDAEPPAEPAGGEGDEPDETADSDGVALYDVEDEESDSDADADGEAAEETVAEDADDTDETEGEADDVFAKLRSARESTDEHDDVDDDADTADDVDDDADEADAADGDADESEPEPDNTDNVDDADDVTGLDVARAGARKRAADAAAKAMKKVLVEEQGTLLDGVRRSGADALGLVEDAASHRAAYEKAAAPALKELASELGGSKRMSLADAHAQIDAIALEPVRQRLGEVADRVEDADELSDTVRALYRESRSRRIDEAAAAAAVAVDGLVVIAKNKGSIVWHVETGGPCGPDCADNALAGEISSGAEFPTGDRHPPAHAACTCWLDPAAD